MKNLIKGGQIGLILSNKQIEYSNACEEMRKVWEQIETHERRRKNNRLVESKTTTSKCLGCTIGDDGEACEECTILEDE
jgi:hypothetical protein